jgi:hypothetical protein
MREYIFTTPLMAGFIKAGFDEHGILVKFENSAILTDNQFTHLYNINYFPITIEKFEALKGKQGKIEEISTITFEKFWEEYGLKKGKIKAQKEWLKTSENDRAKAIAKIKPYKFDCKTHNREMVYPERYLKDRRYDDE